MHVIDTTSLSLSLSKSIKVAKNPRNTLIRTRTKTSNEKNHKKRVRT